jgi:hypothetical protein
MKSIELVLIIAVILITLSIITGTVFFIILLLQIKKVLKDLIYAIKNELHSFFNNCALTMKKIYSPITSIISIISYIISCICKIRNKE